jgi:general secretion pathway protein K
VQSQRQDGGAEDEYYLSLPQPYRAANQALTDINNLYRIKGFTPQVVATLRPYVTVFPLVGDPVPVNVNFAADVVLRALIGGEAAQAVLAQRGNKPFENLEMLRLAVPESSRDKIQPGLVDVRTDYFEAVTHAHFGSVSVAYTSLLSRDTQSAGGAFPRVLWMRRSDPAKIKIPNEYFLRLILFAGILLRQVAATHPQHSWKRTTSRLCVA